MRTPLQGGSLCSNSFEFVLVTPLPPPLFGTLFFFLPFQLERFFASITKAARKGANLSVADGRRGGDRPPPSEDGLIPGRPHFVRDERTPDVVNDDTPYGLYKKLALRNLMSD